jgi:uncharacterized membrane protein YeaQ/YmgE (transglycosylase-associated protein family)
MLIFAWIVLGLIVGRGANGLVHKRNDGGFINVVLGVIGAVFGGELINTLGADGVTGLTPWSGLVSVGAAVLFLVVYQAFLSAPSRPNV